MKKILILMGFLGVNALFIGNAMAIISNGAVTGGTVGNGPPLAQGTFINLGSAPAGISVGNNNFDTKNLYGFNEDQNITLLANLSVDIGTSVAAGTVVASQYIFFDPSDLESVGGWVEFDSEVLGIITSTANLNASDFLLNNSVNYLSPTLRGLEQTDSVSIDATNNQRINLFFTARSPGDYIRVITATSPGGAVSVPEVESILLMSLGLLVLVGGMRKKS